MIEIEYIPLKTPEGQTVGHARVQGGFVDVRYKGDGKGQALVLTDSGCVSGGADMRMRAGGAVTAVAVHTAGTLSCVGFGRAGALTLSDVRRHIIAATKKPVQESPVQAERNPREEKLHRILPAPEETVTLPEPVQPASACMGETEVIPMRRSARHVPAGNEVKLALDRLAQPAEAAFFPPEASEKRDEPRILPVPPEDAEKARADAFEALLARADAVFRRISEPFDDDDAAPLPFTAHPERAASSTALDTSAPEPALASQRLDAWSRAVDDMLSDAPKPTMHSIENPFPHIFPDARFANRGNLFGSETLLGEWERGGERFTVTAVRGDYSPQPPESLSGFTRYIRTLQGGYWVRVEDGPAACAKE